MKSWLQKNLNNIIVSSFLIPILLVAFVSISHVTTFYNTSNPLTWAIYLSVAVEVAALAALAGVSAKFGKFIYIPFGIVTLIQFVGNFFYSYSFIDPQGVQFKEWVDMASAFFEPLGVDPTDIVAHRRILAFLTGGLIPFISLTFAHMLIVYANKIQIEKEQVEPNLIIEDLEVKEEDIQTDVVTEEVEDDTETIEIVESPDKINPSLEELEEMKNRLAKMQTRPLSEILKEENNGVKRLSYTKNV